jgi:predicted TIM-barrel fold metal-dependent hydrolase
VRAGNSAAVEFGDRVPLPLARSQHDVGVRLAEMDDIGVSHRAVSLPPFLFCSTADDGELVADVVARGNSELAAYVAGGQGRLVGLGAVPLGWPGAAAQARSCLDDLGMAGIAIGTRGAGRDLDDPVNDELWDLLAERHRVLERFGQDHILRGTDHPYGLRDAEPLASVAAAELPGAQARAILWDNAAGLLGLASAAAPAR